MMVNIIIIIVIFASILSAVVYMSSSSLRQALSSNQSANAWNMAEAGYRFLSINYLKQTDTNGNGNADDEKAAFLGNVNGRTYVIPNNGQFKLTVLPYWFYNATGATGTITNVTVKLPGTTPANFTMPATGQIKLGNTPGIGIVPYTGGAFNSGTGVFTCTLTSPALLNQGDSVYLVLNPNASQTLTQASTSNTLTLNLNTFSVTPLAFPPKDGLIEINPNPDTHLFRYSTAKAVGTLLTLYGLRRSDNSNFSIPVYAGPTPAASTVTFKKYLMAQSVGQVGTEQRTLSFSEAILDSFPPTSEVHSLNTQAELQANFTQSTSITSSVVQTLNTSGGGSAVFSIINSIDTSKSCGAFWYSNTALINSLWAPPPVGTGVYLLTYEVQVKAATGNALKAGAIGLAFRAKNIGTTSETYLALTFMRYDLPNLYFNRQTGTTAINPGDTVVGATSGATGIVQGTPEITSGSWAGGNATGKIRFASVTGTFSADEFLKVGGVNRAQVNGNNYFACSLPPCTASSTDFIPQTIKPKPSDFTSSSPYYSSRYNIGPLLLVLWEKKSDGTFRWLAFKDITYDNYAKGYQDWGVPDGSCTTGCNGNDGLIVDDNASMYIRLQEKRVNLGAGAIKLNDINVFYGDSTSRYTTPARPGDTIPYNINEGRRLYIAGASPFTPVWAPDYISQWDATVDFFSHIESGTPIGSQPQFQWDAVNPSALADITSGGGVLKICDDGSATCTSAPNGTLRLTELITPDSGSYSQSEMGMLACGNITTSPYSTAGFAEFAFKTPGTTSGGFVDTTLYW
jgi:hypothetical protein